MQLARNLRRSAAGVALALVATCAVATASHAEPGESGSVSCPSTMTPRVRTYTIQNSYGWAPVSKHFNFNWGTQTYRYQYANGTRGGSGSWAAFSSVWIDTAYTSAYCVSGSDPV